MGLASEIDTYFKKGREVGLASDEVLAFKHLWELYQKLNALFGVKIRPFSEVLKEVKLG